MATAQAPPVIPLGSVQYWPIKVFSAFETINSLDGLDLRFDLYKCEDDADTLVIGNASADNLGMLALPLVDTSVVDFEEGLYKVFISFVSSPQTPRLGPFFFKVDD